MFKKELDIQDFLNSKSDLLVNQMMKREGKFDREILAFFENLYLMGLEDSFIKRNTIAPTLGKIEEKFLVFVDYLQ